MADILAFLDAKGRPARADRRDPQGSEVIIFPRTDIRAMLKLWGLPDRRPIATGKGGPVTGARRDDF